MVSKRKREAMVKLEIIKQCQKSCHLFEFLSFIYTDSEPVHNKKILKAKIKSHGDKLQVCMIKKCLRL